MGTSKVGPAICCQLSIGVPVRKPMLPELCGTLLFPSSATP